MKPRISFVLLIIMLPLAAALALPTLINAGEPGLPPPVGENNCLECHRALGGRQAEVAEEWQGSIHAA
ncbi:MAG: hypothetical protein ACE5NP_13305, partial [Anaerolineae bacterium]